MFVLYVSRSVGQYVGLPLPKRQALPDIFDLVRPGSLTLFNDDST